MNFNTDYILEDERVLLRPLLLSDINHLQYIADNEPETWRYSLRTAAGANLFLYVNDALQARKEKKEYAFVVYDKQQQQFAGSTRFYDIQPEHKTLQLGYTWYGGKFRGTGLNKNCKFLLLQFAFETLEYERVEFRADINNETSIAAMKSIGCVEEGIMRNHLALHNGKRRSSIVLSILKPEWLRTIKPQLKNKIYK